MFYLFWYFFSVLFLFACGRSGLLLWGYCSSKTISRATKWTCPPRTKATQAVFNHFTRTGKRLDTFLELQHYQLSLEVFPSLSLEEPRTAAVHGGCGMTYLPYHKLPYSLLIGQIYPHHRTLAEGLQQLVYNIKWNQLSRRRCWCRTCTVVPHVVFCHNVCAGLPCVL